MEMNWAQVVKNSVSPRAGYKHVQTRLMMKLGKSDVCAAHHVRFALRTPRRRPAEPSTAYKAATPCPYATAAVINDTPD